MLSLSRPRPAGIELLAYLRCSAKRLMEVLEQWVKQLLKSRVQTGKGSPSTYILLAIFELRIMQPRHIPISLLILAFKDFICEILVLEKPRLLSSCHNFSLLTSNMRKILPGSQSSHPVSCNILFLQVSKVDAPDLFHTEKGTKQWYFLTTQTTHDRIPPSRRTSPGTLSLQHCCQQEILLHARLSQSNCLVFQ